MSPRSPFFGNSIIPLLTQVFALPPFNLLLQTSRSCKLSAPIFQTSMGILCRPDALVFLKFFMHLFGSSMVKLSVLIGNVCCTTVFLSFVLVTDGCPNRFRKWSFHFLMRSSVLFALILPLFVPFLPVNSFTVSYTILLFWCSAAALISSTFPWA